MFEWLQDHNKIAKYSMEVSKVLNRDFFIIAGAWSIEVWEMEIIFICLNHYEYFPWYTLNTYIFESTEKNNNHIWIFKKS